MIWVSYGYDGAIAGNFFVFHSRRPTPEQLGIEQIDDYTQDDQCYNGTLENGTITVCSIKHFIESVPIRENGFELVDGKKEVNSLQVDDPSKGKNGACSWCGAKSCIIGCRKG